ncbi:hypothetical protein A4A49_24982 [Nicotiana attenuata]|uniref:Uncharacterized protein n=1 Tax=Nicotiana attenuata TaxID=49451 RepID=A0A1J6L046_NICAT|nr:hypothetical protein A4A49_24982 [Nicotiana attenuata]
MANLAGGQPLTMAGQPPQPSPVDSQPQAQPKTPLDYSTILKPSTINAPMHATTGKELVPTTNTNVQQDQGATSQNNATAGMEIVPADVTRQQGIETTSVERGPIGVAQQIQTANKFAALQEDDGETNKENQLAIVEEPVDHRSPIQNNKKAGLLNPVAAVFTPRSGVASSKRGKVADPSGVDGVAKAANSGVIEKVPKESTAQWVSRTIANNVATNQSCQEIPSQSIEFDAVERVSKNERLQKSGNKLWHEQTEEESDEGEVPVGAIGEEESADEENDQEEQNVNKGKNP